MTKLQAIVSNGSIVGFSSSDPREITIGYCPNQLGYRSYANTVKPVFTKKFKTAAAKKRFVDNLLKMVGATSTEDFNVPGFARNEGGYPVRLATIPPQHPENWRNRGYLSQPDDLVAISSIEGGDWIQFEDESGLNWVETLAKHDEVARLKNTRIGPMSVKIALADGLEFNIDLGSSTDAVRKLQALANKLGALYGHDDNDLIRRRRSPQGNVEVGSLFGSNPSWVNLSSSSAATEED